MFVTLFVTVLSWTQFLSAIFSECLTSISMKLRNLATTKLWFTTDTHFRYVIFLSYAVMFWLGLLVLTTHGNLLHFNK